MRRETLRQEIDILVDLALRIYSFLETHERNLIQLGMQDFEQVEVLDTNILIRKRILNYLILDAQQATFQSLWANYQSLFRKLYRDFHIRSASPLQDDLFASREIIEDVLIDVRDVVTFKHAFLQKAYHCFGVDFKPVRENCLFLKEEEKDTFTNEEFHKNFEDEHSQVCRMM
jgi:hypothetical protein